MEPTTEVIPLSQRLSLTLDECSSLTGLKVCALRSAIWSGDLPFVRSGTRGQYLIRRESLEKFLRASEQREGQR
jgi:excisionase family DNA binding protein